VAQAVWAYWLTSSEGLNAKAEAQLARSVSTQTIVLALGFAIAAVRSERER